MYLLSSQQQMQYWMYLLGILKSVASVTWITVLWSTVNCENIVISYSFDHPQLPSKNQLNGLIIDAVLGYGEIIYLTHTRIESIVFLGHWALGMNNMYTELIIGSPSDVQNIWVAHFRNWSRKMLLLWRAVAALSLWNL